MDARPKDLRKNEQIDPRITLGYIRINQMVSLERKIQKDLWEQEPKPDQGNPTSTISLIWIEPCSYDKGKAA